MTPVREMIADLLKQGAKMVVCPMCAGITGVETDELAPGIEMIEDRKQIFDHMHADSVVFTY
jgi:predicted peroxiredoxin